MIDVIFQTVKTFLNTDGRGNFTPMEFNLMLNNSVQEIYNYYITEINQQVNRENRGLINGGLENLADKIREKVSHYLKKETLSPVTAGNFTIPTDCKYFDTILAPSGRSLEVCRSRDEFETLKNTVANIDFPIVLKAGQTISCHPTTFTSIDIWYLRNPLFAKWTYVVTGGGEIFNPSASDFQDVDIHPADQTDLIIKICQKFGVNLKEPDLAAYFQMKEAEKLDKQNRS